jgi:exodeoxyribonuclease VII large subunit
VAPSAEHVAQRVAVLAARLARLAGRQIQGARQRLEAANRHLRLLHPTARLQQQAQRLDQLERRLSEGVQGRLREARDRLSPQRSRLLGRSPMDRLVRASAALEGLTGRLRWAQGRVAEQCRQGLARAVGGLEARSPLATLARGYAIVTRVRDGAIVRSPADAPPGTPIEARLREGSLRAVAEPNAGRLGPAGGRTRKGR